MHAVDWSAVRRAAVGFLLLASVKLVALVSDYAVARYVELAAVLRDAADQQAAPVWAPYEDLLEPNTPQSRLDWHRCALLHNRIVELAWLGHHNSSASGSGRDPASRDRRTWWDRHRAEVEPVEARLTPELVAFLQHAEMPEDGLSFTYELQGLAPPWKMFDFLDNFDEGEYMLVLYEVSWSVESEGLGLLFDKHAAVVHYSPWEDLISDRLNWFPLELALGTYLGQIEAGKYLALPQQQLDELDDYRPEHSPWAMMPWEMHGGIELAVAKLDLLIQAIWDRMPAEAQTTTRQLRRHESRMISEPALVAAPQNSFLYQFLTRAPACPFDFIAPGIKCPTDDTIASILSEPPVPPSYAARGEDLSALPVLLFASDERVADDVDGGDFYGWYNATLTGVRGGLYLDGRSHHGGYQDGVQLVTPFSIRENGWARTGDGQEILDFAWELYETRADHRPDAYISLFQLGSNAFVNPHHTNLHTVLAHWLDLVESGLWPVGADGVAGGMEVFKMADSEEQWWRYSVPAASH
ncbi:hypothetical protein UCRNP2_4382 [Neofusicoccum parvum UCRNP2]|uniref:Uncharacterized protein n=1 Tax=Botryosphaeria parva (strain UCR-NP2) TaxID=1287680 RepID=R1GKP8_BOTPV|nr:hypothetical protein UCRNP2_4382 [Neofusicoccum parvum UCRNP2]